MPFALTSNLLCHVHHHLTSLRLFPSRGLLQRSLLCTFRHPLVIPSTFPSSAPSILPSAIPSVLPSDAPSSSTPAIDCAIYFAIGVTFNRVNPHPGADIDWFVYSSFWCGTLSFLHTCDVILRILPLPSIFRLASSTTHSAHPVPNKSHEIHWEFNTARRISNSSPWPIHSLALIKFKLATMIAIYAGSLCALAR